MLLLLGPGTHVHVLPAGQPALARPQGGHPQGALPEDRRHQARHAHRGQKLLSSFHDFVTSTFLKKSLLVFEHRTKEDKKKKF